MRGKKVGSAIFDMDGTLVDSVDFHAQAWQETFAHFGHRISFGKIRDQIGKGSDQLLPTFLSPADLKEQSEDLQEYRGKLFRSKFLHRVRPFPAGEQLLRRLREMGWKIAIASSSDPEDLRHYLKICGIARLVDAKVTAADVEKSKPQPDAPRVARRKLRMSPSFPAVVVGDSPYDAMAAVKAKMEAVGILAGGFGPKKLRAAGCRELYKNPAHLLARLESSVFSQS